MCTYIVHTDIYVVHVCSTYVPDSPAENTSRGTSYLLVVSNRRLHPGLKGKGKHTVTYMFMSLVRVCGCAHV